MRANDFGVRVVRCALCIVRCVLCARPDQIHSDKDYVGITESADGVHWSVAQYVSLNKTACSGGRGTVRTPQGLVAEPGKCKGCYSMLYTMLAGSFRPVCYVLLRNTAEL